MKKEMPNIRTEFLANITDDCGYNQIECEQWGLFCEECNAKDLNEDSVRMT